MMKNVQQMTDLFESLGILNRDQDGLSLKEELPPLCVELDDSDFKIEWADVPGSDSGEKLVYVIEFLKGVGGIEDVGIEEAWNEGLTWKENQPAWLKAA